MTAIPHDNSLMAADAYSIHGRVDTLERRVDGHDASIVKLQLSDATFTEQIDALRHSNYALKGSMDKVLWALIGLALTIAGSCTALLLSHMAA